ncbi:MULTISPECIES: hypothetical protein [unclassified Streptomyces]|uniref:hypothetical protein n=1 Tax=unclassified Streptomyces TaxID=2593676 RepID=UPI0008DC6365|nr:MULTISPECIES: hypothetical protein [unclassified Streptomyces]OII60448.1 hypothetical protein BJP39_10905 [Streptomyces sp. CC77]
MRRVAGALLAGCAALGLGGCDVPETDVIDAGGPATVKVVPRPSTGLFVFLRSPSGGLAPSVRYQDAATDLSDASGVSTAASWMVATLFAGPLPHEQEAGLTDGLPELPFEGVTRTEPLPDGGVEVTLPIALGDLDDLAVRQLVCTVAFAEDTEGSTPVRLRGTDRALARTVCGADLDLGALPGQPVPPTAGSAPPGR